MSRNAIRMICLTGIRRIVYAFRNSNGAWTPLSWSSPLIIRYTETTMSESAEEIIAEIDRVYNRNNAGVDIFIEGDNRSYDICSKVIGEHYRERNIRCERTQAGVIVIGIVGSGKTTLVDKIKDALSNVYSGESDNADSYVDKWYEIDIQYNEQEKAAEAVYDIIDKNDIQAIIYCVNAADSRFTEWEENFVKIVAARYPEITLIIALTQSYGRKERILEFADEIARMTGNIKVIPVLAIKKNLETDDGKIHSRDSYGVDTLIDALLG